MATIIKKNENENEKKTITIIKHIQNAVGLFISVFTIYCIYSNTFTIIIPCIYFQCIFELFISLPIDVIIHHLLAIAILSLFVFNILQINDYLYELKIFLSIEISTIFLIINNYISSSPSSSPSSISPTLIILNQFCFTSSFFYTRLYLYANYILIIKKEPYILFLIYSFFILNCYWFAIIIKKLVKPIHVAAATSSLMPILLYIPFILYTIYFYNFIYPDILCSILGISGLLYICYTTKKVNEFTPLMNILDDKLIFMYLHHIFAINIQPLIYLNIHNPFFAFSIFVHSICTLGYFLFMLEMKKNEITFGFMSDNLLVKRAINLMIGLPFIVDSCIMFFDTPTYIIPHHNHKINIFICTISLFIILIVKPFYSWTYIFIIFAGLLRNTSTL